MKRKTKNELEKQKQEFAKKYDSVRVYKRTSKPSMKQFFYCPKFLEEGFKLSKAAMSIYPVMCIHADFENNNWFQMSEEFIRKETGLSKASVQNALEEMATKKYAIKCDKKMILLLEREPKTEGTRHFYMYKAGFIRKSLLPQFKGQFFIFHQVIITSGVWANLSMKAKALYIAMRHRAFFDLEAYTSMEGEYTGPKDFDFKEEFVDRLWDTCLTPLTDLCKLAGLEYDGMPKCIEELEHVGLLLRIENVGFMVYLKPNIMMRY